MTCRRAGRPRFSSSYNKHVSYTLSSSPGPTCEWILIAEAIMASPISFSVTSASSAKTSASSAVKCCPLGEELADLGEQLARAERLGDIVVAAGGARLGVVARERIGGDRDDRHLRQLGDGA